MAVSAKGREIFRYITPEFCGISLMYVIIDSEYIRIVLKWVSFGEMLKLQREMMHWQ